MATLLKIRGFLPFIFVMFINASVDLAHKITIQNILNKCYGGEQLVVLTALVNAMILLPFIFLFSSSGFLNDKFSKTAVIRVCALLGVALALVVLFSYIQGWFVFAFAATLLLAIQSAIYSPAKYGLIKRLVGVENLSLANGVVQALTIVAILLSSFAFSFAFEARFYDAFGQTFEYDPRISDPDAIVSLMIPIGVAIVALAIAEAFFAFRLPRFPAEPSAEKFSFAKLAALKYLRENLREIRSNRDIWLSIIGLSIFWGLSQMILAAFGAHYKAVTGDDDNVTIQGIMAISAIGLVFGSSLAGSLSKRHIELGIIPVGAIGAAAALLGLSYSTTVAAMGFCSLAFGFFGGLAIVPLNSVVQYFAGDDQMGKVLAGNNFMQNCSMVLFLAIAVALTQIGFSTTALFTIAAILAALSAIWAVKLMPHLFARVALFPILRMGYKLSVQGVENIPPTGGALLLGNHISWIDWLILQVACPRALKFVMFKGIYDKPFLRGFFRFFDVIPIAGGASKSAIESIRARLQNGEVVALFPEGIISYNGQIGKFERGFEVAIDGIDAPIIPFYLRGLWGSSFSRAEDYYKSLRRKSGSGEIVVAFGEKLAPSAKAAEVKQAVIALSVKAWDFYLSRQKPLHIQWLRRAKSRPFAIAIADEGANARLSNWKLLVSVFLFMHKLRPILSAQENVGVLLPSSAAGAIVNLALFALGKKPINLNYTVSRENLLSAAEQSGLKTIVTARIFAKKLEGRGFDLSELLETRAVYAEDLKATIKKSEAIAAFLTVFLLPRFAIEAIFFADPNPDETATILFSSGSESAPKGIELTHKNLLANIRQVADLLNFRRDDVVLNALPIFHSFGLTITTLMPLAEGVLMVAIPDPTDAPLIGKACAKYRASILLGTSTFYRLYVKNKKLYPIMLQTVRLAIAGAEKLKIEVRDGFKLKFGIDILEGYGATETAPVVCVNMPDAIERDAYKPLTFHKEGSVGLPLPGTLVKIVDPETLEELPTESEGLILIGGPQVMKGYYQNPEKTAEAIAEIDGWRYYKSGDKGRIDADGFVTIVDRYSRFAKIGGEMISLSSVETWVAKAANLAGEEFDCAAIAAADEKKGEKIALFYMGEIDETTLGDRVRAAVPPLMIPTDIKRIDALPKLASGKTDYKAIKLLLDD